MKGTDKFLISIVSGVIVLIVAAFVVALTRPVPTYKSDSTAEGVAFNYLLAFHRSDYGRAQGYLSRSLKSRPNSAEQFGRDVERMGYSPSRNENTTWSIESSRVTGDRTIVIVRQMVYSSSAFSSQYSSTFEIRMQLEDGAWKIVDSGSNWAPCWESSRGCISD